MRLRPLLLPVLPLLLLTALVGVWLLSRRDTQTENYEVKTSVFEKWSPLLGRLEAANPITLRAELDGLSKITWLIDDGTPVENGEVLALFEPSELEEKRLNLTRDLEIAQAEYRSLSEAQHPLEMQRLVGEKRSLESEKKAEQALLNQTKELVDEQLLAASELNRHQNAISELDTKIASMEEQIRLTLEVLHPTVEQTAKARLDAAKTALERVEERLKKTRVLAPSAGTVYLPPLHIDGEHRRLRVGDGLFRNQVFMELADLTNLVLKSSIGEQDLSGIVPGLQARVVFPAYPKQSFEATITRVGTHPEGSQQRYPLQLELHESASALRPGLTAEIEVLEYRVEDALMVPREFFRFREGTNELNIRGKDWQAVRTGDGNAGSIRVLEGVEADDILLHP